MRRFLVGTWLAFASFGCGRADTIPADFAPDDGRQWIDAMPSASAAELIRLLQSGTLTIDFRRMTLGLR